MGAKKENHEEVSLKHFWDFVQEVPKDKWIKLDAKKLAKEIYGSSDPSVGYGVRLLAKVALACSDFNEFETAMSTNELPAVKLDKEEMHVLKGGLIDPALYGGSSGGFGGGLSGVWGGISLGPSRGKLEIKIEGIAVGELKGKNEFKSGALKDIASSGNYSGGNRSGLMSRMRYYMK